MPVCITGMHRSGTSMIARLLNQCGLSLGPEDELLPPNEFNTEGYWENEQFVKINDELLSHFGGGWDIPPSFPEGWQDLAELDPLRRRAQELVERFTRFEPWGWKDPRSSLTLPFWRSIIPDLKVLVCVRNPLEVIVSLAKRAHCSDAFGLALWLEYNRQALANAAGLDYAVTHYDAYYEDAPAELQRVLDALGIAWSDADLERATAFVVSGVRHHRVGMQDLPDAGVSGQVIDSYTHLLELGRVRGSLAEHTSDLMATGASQNDTVALKSSYAAMRLVRLEAEVQHLRKSVRAKDKETARHTDMISEQAARHADMISEQLVIKDKEMAMLLEMVSQQQETIETLTARLQTLLERNNESRAFQLRLGGREAELEKRQAEMERQVAWYKSQLEEIKGTMFYKLGAFYWTLHAQLRRGR